MVKTCIDCDKKYLIIFNYTKSNLLCFNVNNDDAPHNTLNGYPLLSFKSITLSRLTSYINCKGNILFYCRYQCHCRCHIRNL